MLLPSSLWQKRPQLEALPDSKYRAFHCRHFAKPKFDFIWHHHPEVELTYIIKGYGIRSIGHSIQPFYAGDLCLMGSDVPHSYGSHPRMQGGAEWIVLQFLPERFGPDFWKLPGICLLQNLLDSSQRGIRFHGRGVSECVQRLKNLVLNESSFEGLSLFFQVFQALLSVQQSTLLNPLAAVSGFKPMIDPRMQKILAWVEASEPDSITQKNAAKLVHMSPPAFSRYFRNRTGKVFVRYLNEHRMARACVSLSMGKHSITEIAFDSGFRNLSNFNRRFKEMMGITPREYRATLPQK